MPKDEDTLRFYAKEAAAYTSRGKEAIHQHLDAFLDNIPPGGAILEMGCGAGQDSEHMISRGFAVTPTDGTPESDNQKHITPRNCQTNARQVG